MKWRTRIARVAGQLAATLRYGRQHAAAWYCILPMLASLRWLLPADGTRRIRSPDSLERAAMLVVVIRAVGG
jgi:hypothetical protein